MAIEAAIADISSARTDGDKVSASFLSSILARCNAPADGASLALFRILFGSVMAVAMVRLLMKGWVHELYLAPAFHFTWEWFPWVKVLPGAGMYWLVGAMALLALGIAVGWHLKLCAALFFAGFVYLELIDQTTYLNHYYLVSLLCGLLIFLPADAAWSWRVHKNGEAMAPVWAIWLLRFQLAAVYLFAGIAKLNADWLFKAQPMRIWLAARSDLPLVGPFLAKTWVAYAASWTGAAYDLSIPFLLLWARSRRWAYLAVVLFHVMTALLFNIGMFPWIMMVAAVVFFPAEELRKFFRGRGIPSHPGPLPQGGEGEGQKHRISNFERPTSKGVCGWRLQRVGLAVLGCYVLVQIALPLRSFLYPQQGAWDGRGFNFAWRVMLVEKTGYVEFFAVNPATQKRERLRTDHLITPRQKMLMAQDPEMIRQVACRLAEDFPREGKRGWEVRVDAWATINGRPSQRLIRPEVNLAGRLPADWIVPLRKN